MIISTFLTIDAGTPLKSYYEGKGIYKYAEQGEIIYPIKSPIPIIQRGKGCIGIAVVSKLEITETSTVALFTVTEVDAASAQAYYRLYRNTVSMSSTSTGDVYKDSEDMVIPGAMGPVQKMKRPGGNNSGRSLAEEAGLYGNNNRNRSIYNGRDDD